MRRDLLAAAAAAAWVAATQAADLGSEAARRLRAAGVIVPLAAVVSKAQRAYPGRLLEVELERSGTRYLYKLEVVGAGGIVWELYYDARDATLLAAEPER